MAITRDEEMMQFHCNTPLIANPVWIGFDHAGLMRLMSITGLTPNQLFDRGRRMLKYGERIQLVRMVVER